jgi:SAM-dependent methyltransferase
MEIEQQIKTLVPGFKRAIQKAAQEARNEAEFRTKITGLIENIASNLNLVLHLREEYTLINGRADAVYNRLVIEYEPPNSLRQKNSYRANQHAINQIKDYVEGLVRRERHRPERLAGVVLDGSYFIFVRSKDEVWRIDDPLKVDDYSAEFFLKLLLSLSTELALIPENLIRDFGENTPVARTVVSELFKKLLSSPTPKAKALFDQWSLQFSEVCDYEEASKLRVEAFSRKYGISDQKTSPFHFFFCLHTYYAAFIKLLAVQVVQYYAMPKLGTNLKQAATLASDDLRAYLSKMEEGGIFKELGIINFIEGDFFSWYLDIWDEGIFSSLKALISTLANYSLVTLDVDPDTTRDLLKKLYQQLMPRELRHNLGEYYTPDWLAQRVLNLVDDGEFKGDPHKRILDPACGSGTFLVLAIKKIRDYAWKNALPESETLESILANVVGFDLNPLAVISARTNYLLALGELLQHRKREINIPVYLCDSILTPHEGEDLFTKGTVKFNTTVGPFSVPKNLIQANYIDILSNFLEEAVKLTLNKEQFTAALSNKLPLDIKKDEKDIDLTYTLYEKLLNLDEQGINGIWARIIKNAFAPLFVGEFDYIAGNPPWINWESLPEQYRTETKPLWISYGLFPHGGMDTILGKGKKDISMLMTYVAIDKYLRIGGKLAFLITQSVFKTSGAGQGFRRFKLGDKGHFIQVIYVDDLVELKPFEGASNRTSALVLRKGSETKYIEKVTGGRVNYLLPYTYWKKTIKGNSIAMDSELEDVLKVCECKNYYALPVNKNDPTSAWLTGRPKALRAIDKILGQSDYIAHEGVNSGGANGVYWVDIVDKRPDGFIVISNIVEGSRKEIESVQAALESDLVYPLLRGRDIKKWIGIPSAFIIMVQDPVKRKGIEERQMKAKYPKTYLYLKRFELSLRDRSAFKRYFTRKDNFGRIYEVGPFYSMFGVGDYTFAQYKVVWPWISVGIRATVVDKIENKPICPEHNAFFIDFEKKDEAYFFCAMINSSIADYAIRSFYCGGGGGIASPAVLQNVFIPKYDKKDKLQAKIAELSKEAHKAAKREEADLKIIEEEIDQLSAKIWDIASEELKEIKLSLKELS